MSGTFVPSKVVHASLIFTCTVGRDCYIAPCPSAFYACVQELTHTNCCAQIRIPLLSLPPLGRSTMMTTMPTTTIKYYSFAEASRAPMVFLGISLCLRTPSLVFSLSRSLRRLPPQLLARWFCLFGQVDQCIFLLSY